MVEIWFSEEGGCPLFDAGSLEVEMGTADVSIAGICFVVRRLGIFGFCSGFVWPEYF